MLTQCDDWLMDKVFQPIADRVADRCSPFRLAELGAEMVIAMLMGRAAYAALTNSFTLLLLIVGGMVLFVSLRLRHVVRNAERRYRMGTRNPLRIHFSSARKASLLLFSLWAVFMALFWVAGFPLGVIDLFLTGELLGWMLVYFFASCDQNPPQTVEEKQDTRVHAFT